MTGFAEVIGDPIAHSLSPAIHGHWLKTLGASGEYRATRVRPEALASFVGSRRRDGAWRGCNVTAPHKQSVIQLLDEVTEAASQVGAVNCIYTSEDRLIGTNTDVDGMREALASIDLRQRKAVLIGGGGAARAAIHHLQRAGLKEAVLLVRRPDRASLPSGVGIRAAPLTAAPREFLGADLIINASPLGMSGSSPMPFHIIDALSFAPEATVMDMVYDPFETSLLTAARRRGLKTIDGLAMLIGQARGAFSTFFGLEPPADSTSLRELLLTQTPRRDRDRHRMTGRPPQGPSSPPIV